jgi:hypothetical protein
MKLHTTQRRFFSIMFAVALSLLIGGFTYVSFGANVGASAFALAPTTAQCFGQTVPATFQGDRVGLVLRQYWDNELISVSIGFPDGRVFSPLVADGRVADMGGLDGIIDMPANEPFIDLTTNGGDYYFTFQTSNRWPYGCYVFTALGQRSNRQSQVAFAVIPQVGSAPNAGPSTLNVEDNTTGAPSGLHGATVNIFGRGFRAQETVSVWITAPDGTIIDYPQQFTSNVGSFASTFVFSEAYPVGEYKFTALGTSSGYQVITDFHLDARPSVENGWGQIRVAWRYPETLRQDQQFEIQGQFFEPFEFINIWVTLPDGSVRGLPQQQANSYGEFYALIGLDERLPVGNYAFTVQGPASGHLAITRVDVTPGSPNVTQSPPNPEPVPQVVENDPSTGGGLGGATTSVSIPQQNQDEILRKEELPDF